MRTSLRRVLVALTATTMSLVALPAITDDGARAATADTTRLAFDSGLKTRGVYNDTILPYLSGTITDTTNPAIHPTGTIYLQRQAVGTTTWKTIDSAATDYRAYFGAHKFKANARFRMYYPGGADASGTYAPSVSPVLLVRTLRKLKVTGRAGRQAHVRVTVTPNFHHKRLVLLRKDGRHFTKVGRPRTNAHGVARFALSGSRHGTKFRVVARGTKKLTTTTASFTITRSA